MEYKRYTMHSFRVGGAASHSMDGTAMEVLMEYVGWKSAAVARRYVGVTASAAAAGVKRSRETAFIEADALPFPNSLHVRIQRSGGATEAEPTRGQGRSLGRIRTTRQPAETTRGKDNKRQIYDGMETSGKRQEGWV